jgi:hypothetical protein
MLTESYEWEHKMDAINMDATGTFPKETGGGSPKICLEIYVQATLKFF